MSLPRDRFAARLAAAPLLADGGMGTLLFSRGIPQRACLDELATSPELRRITVSSLARWAERLDVDT